MNDVWFRDTVLKGITFDCVFFLAFLAEHCSFKSSSSLNVMQIKYRESEMHKYISTLTLENSFHQI